MALEHGVMRLSCCSYELRPLSNQAHRCTLGVVCLLLRKQFLVASCSNSMKACAPVCRAAAEARISTSGFNLADADFAVLHSPFVKMVRKGFARLAYQDHLRSLARRTASREVRPSLSGYPTTTGTAAIV